jgi:hypothetical protein
VQVEKRRLAVFRLGIPGLEPGSVGSLQVHHVDPGQTLVFGRLQTTGRLEHIAALIGIEIGRRRDIGDRDSHQRKTNP